MKESNIKRYIDGKLEFDVTDNSFPKGAISVGTFNAGASFDNLTVEGSEISHTVDVGNKLTQIWVTIKVKE